jgi:RNA polymerase sigma factor (sigma-70 family)
MPSNAQINLLIVTHQDLAEDFARWMFDWPRRRIWLTKAEAVAMRALTWAATHYDEEKGDFHTFARRILARFLSDFLRRCRKRHPNPPIVRPLDEYDRGDRAENWLARSEEVGVDKIPADILELLPPTQREVLRRRFELGESFREIGVALKKSKASAHRQYVRAINALRRHLGPDPDHR